MLATSTHDTKRGEDVRARINVLSEMPDRWRSAITRWAKFNKRFRTEIDEIHAPDRNEEYLLYQTLVGAWPVTTMDDPQYEVFIGRIQAYMIKAIREAKTHTSWVNPHEVYEKAVSGFVRSILDRSTRNLFLEDLVSFQESLSGHGMTNGLSQLLLKLTAPGVPDCYQGSELWDLTLVDPDNRRPVDFALRSEMLGQLNAACVQNHDDRVELVRGLMDMWTDGRIKLYLLHTVLRHRRANPQLYLEGDYVPLDCEGTSRSHVCAYARMHHDQAVVVVVPRLLVELSAAPGAPGGAVWQDTQMTVPSWKPGSVYLNLLTGERLETIAQGEKQVLSLAQIFKHCPVALLERCS